MYTRPIRGLTAAGQLSAYLMPEQLRTAQTDGSKVIAKYVLKDAKPPELRETFKFTGGTATYARITGSGDTTSSWSATRPCGMNSAASTRN